MSGARTLGLACALAAFGGASLGLGNGCSSSDEAATSPSTDGGAFVGEGGACAETEVRCGVECVELDHAHDHCGACAVACAADHVCVNGGCTTCAERHLDACGSTCTDLLTDDTSCGACGHACAKGSSCNNGRCEGTCGDGGAACATGCVDLGTDEGNCGECGHVCGPAQTCTNAICRCAIASQVACGAACVDPLIDKTHCGATAGCGSTAGFTGEKCEASGYCKAASCSLCQTWTQGWTVSLGPDSNPFAMALQDFNKDGKLDIALLDNATSKVHLYLGKGNGTFTVAGVYSGGAQTLTMTVTDLDGDGNLDLVFGNTAPTANRYVSTLRGVGDGTFVAGPIVNHVSAAESIAAGDLNGDGKTDLVVSGGGYQGAADVRTYLRKADGTYTRSADYSAVLQTILGAPFGTLALADADADGHVDLVVASAATGILYGDGSGALAPGWVAPAFALPGQLLLVGDVDRDGKVDVVTGSGAAGGGLWIHRANGARAFKTPIGATTFPSSLSTLLADVTGDGILDLVGVLGEGPATLSVRAGKGDGTFLPEHQSPFDVDSTGQLAAGDLNGDGRLDIVGVTFHGVRVLLGTKPNVPECP